MKYALVNIETGVVEGMVGPNTYDFSAGESLLGGEAAFIIPDLFKNESFIYPKHPILPMPNDQLQQQIYTGREVLAARGESQAQEDTQ